MMKKFISIVLLAVLSLPIQADALRIKVNGQNGETLHLETVQVEKIRKVTTREAFNTLFGDLDAPKSYKYIKLNYRDVKEGTQLYDTLQKAVYFDYIENKPVLIGEDSNISQYIYLRLIKAKTGEDLIKDLNVKLLKKTDLTNQDINDYNAILSRKEFEAKIEEYNQDIETKIYDDVLNTIEKNHIGKDNFDRKKLIYSSIQGLTDGTGDKHTVFFPPNESKDFLNDLNGNFEGIGAYVTMEKPGVFVITSPIENGPAFKAGLLAGDRILEVDGREITKDITQNEAISWIKGKAGTIVKLKIERGNKILNFDVTRDEVVIPEVETKIYGVNTYYIKMRTFGDNIAEDFEKALDEISEKSSIRRIVLDLRGNPGGYLSQVSKMLDHVVPEGEPKVVVKGLEDDEIHYSIGGDKINFSNYKIIILVDGGTASASEILTGTIKDYFPGTVVIGTKTFGKGSVQTIRNYKGGSSLKYTIAKWYTGKTETGIDGVGINPDVELEFDIERFKQDRYDNQLEKAIRY